MGAPRVDSITSAVGAPLGCPGEERITRRSELLDRRAPRARARGRAAGDPVPALRRLARRGAPLPGGAQRDRPRRAARLSRGVRRGEGAARGGIRHSAGSGDGREAAGGGERGAGGGGTVRPTAPLLPPRLAAV